MDVRGPPQGITARRPLILSLAKLLFLALANLPQLRAVPIRFLPFTAGFDQHAFEADPVEPVGSPTLWIYLTVAVGLVLLGGAFAGLTIALMGQDEIYLQVIEKSGDGAEKHHAAKVLRLLKRGKHWVLVTLLLGNVITNETLPIVLDRSLGGGWPAVLGSTVLIVIFGEIIPQSICVRYGLPIGAWMSPLVLVLMYILAPVAWPTAKLLDRLLGEDHGTTYKKAGLKTLVTLHKTLGSAGEQLNSDEVTIISAVLDLKEKPVGSIMTPMDDVFTMSADTVLDEKTMDIILSAGYSRIPIHAPESPMDFVGMLLVKILITYDPEDCKKVRDFALATLPETRPETSCLDIVNYFQEGKSHMVLVTAFPGEDKGALGVVTLEDVIEELIGEEIIDESDVFIDVHKAIRRMAPAPKYRVPKGEIMTEPNEVVSNGHDALVDVSEDQQLSHEALRRLMTEDAATDGKTKPSVQGTSPKASYFTRRTSSLTGQSDRDGILKRPEHPEMREQFKHLGPSNLASRPRQTRYNTVKIKSGGSKSDGVPKVHELHEEDETPRTMLISQAAHGGIGEGLVASAGKDASDGVQAVQQGYGSMDSPPCSPKSPETTNKGFQVDGDSRDVEFGSPTRKITIREDSVESHRTAPDYRARAFGPRKGGARSGSITENIIDANGVRKVVLETTSSSEDNEQGANNDPSTANEDGAGDERKENKKAEDEDLSKSGKKKRRRKRKKGGSTLDEDTPLLERYKD